MDSLRICAVEYPTHALTDQSAAPTHSPMLGGHAHINLSFAVQAEIHPELSESFAVLVLAYEDETLRIFNFACEPGLMLFPGDRLWRKRGRSHGRIRCPLPQQMTVFSPRRP